MLAVKRSASSCHRGTMRCDLPTAQAAALFCKQVQGPGHSVPLHHGMQ